MKAQTLYHSLILTLLLSACAPWSAGLGQGAAQGSAPAQPPAGQPTQPPAGAPAQPQPVGGQAQPAQPTPAMPTDSGQGQTGGDQGGQLGGGTPPAEANGTLVRVMSEAGGVGRRQDPRRTLHFKSPDP